MDPTGVRREAEVAGWTEEHRLGVPGVDAEHRAFFTLVRNVEAGLAEGDAAGARAALAELRRHAVDHFASEEAYLETLGYPEVGRQRAEHAEFLLDLEVLERAPGLPTATAVRMARAWIGQHILGSDRRYSAWLDAANGPPPALRPAPARR